MRSRSGKEKPTGSASFCFSPRFSTREAGRLFLSWSIRLDGKQAGAIDVNAFGDQVDDFVPGVRGTAIFGPFRSPFSGHSDRFFGILSYWHEFSPIFWTFCPICGHFHAVFGHHPAMSAIVCSRRSVLLAAIRAVCLEKIAPPIGWDGRGDLVENDGVPCFTVIERHEDGFWQKKFPNKSVADK